LGQGSARLDRENILKPMKKKRAHRPFACMTLIDTAELYGSEEFIGRAIAGQRNRVFLVSKVCPLMSRETESCALARRASSASVLIISISICCIGQRGHESLQRCDPV